MAQQPRVIAEESQPASSRRRDVSASIRDKEPAPMLEHETRGQRRLVRTIEFAVAYRLIHRDGLVLLKRRAFPHQSIPLVPPPASRRSFTMPRTMNADGSR